MKSVLIIAPHFGPTNQVGALRVNDWLNRFSEKGWNCQVASTYTVADPRVIFIPQGKSIWQWCFRVWKWGQGKNFDLIIFSGGPFEPFFLSGFFRLIRRQKTWLDFRDPFANNPKFHEGFLKRTLKSLIQTFFILSSTRVSTVNEQCAEMMSFPADGLVIPNGFDEKEVESVLKNSNHAEGIVHAGKWYTDPAHLVHFTADKSTITTISMPFPSAGHVIHHESMPYRHVLEKIHSNEIGLILAQGSSFETLTKIYDYLGLGLKIWVISEIDETRTGIKDMLANYPRAVFSLNNPESIAEGWEKLRTLPKDKTPYNVNSRKAAFEKLFQAIESMTA